MPPQKRGDWNPKRNNLTWSATKRIIMFNTDESKLLNYLVSIGKVKSNQRIIQICYLLFSHTEKHVKMTKKDDYLKLLNTIWLLQNVFINGFTWSEPIWYPNSKTNVNLKNYFYQLNNSPKITKVQFFIFLSHLDWLNNKDSSKERDE